MVRFSKRTLRVLADELAQSWLLATSEDLFEDNGTPQGCPERPEATGQRRVLLETYLASLDLTTEEGAAALVRVFNDVLESVQERERSRQTGTSNSSPQLRRDGFSVDEDNARILGDRSGSQSWRSPPFRTQRPSVTT